LQDSIYEVLVTQEKVHLHKEWLISDTALTTYIPLKNHKGLVVGALAVTYPQDSLSQTSPLISSEEVPVVFAVVLIALLLSALVMMIIHSKINSPLQKIIEHTEQVRKGDMRYGVSVNSYQELNRLADAMNIMTRYLRKHLVKKEREIISKLSLMHSKQIISNIKKIKKLKDVDSLLSMLKRK